MGDVNQLLPSRRRRRRFWIFLLLVLPVTAVGISLTIAWRVGSRRLEQAIARADRLDPHWRLDDIETDRQPFPPPGKNAIDQIVAMHEALQNVGYGQWAFPQFERDPAALEAARTQMYARLAQERSPVLLDAEQVRILTEDQAKATGALKLARELVNFPGGRSRLIYAKNPANTMLDETLKVRSAADLLRHDALLRAHNGDISGAFLDVKALFHASRAIGDEPLSVSMLICEVLNGISVSMLERTLGLGEATEADLRELQQYLLEQDQVPYFLIGARGDRACYDLLLERIQNGELSTEEFTKMGLTAGSSATVRTLLLGYHQLTIKQQRAEILDLMTDLIEIGKLPIEYQQDAFDAWFQKMQKIEPWHVGYAILMPINKFGDADLRTRASLRTAAVGLAAERFRLATKRWPDSLAELVPQFIEKPPVDPFSGMPLKLHRTGETFEINSVFNGIGFRLFDPAKRRQPARPALKLSKVA
jgi:hypothetical protein